MNLFPRNPVWYGLMGSLIAVGRCEAIKRVRNLESAQIRDIGLQFDSEDHRRPEVLVYAVLVGTFSNNERKNSGINFLMIIVQRVVIVFLFICQWGLQDVELVLDSMSLWLASVYVLLGHILIGDMMRA
ncbi:hypothetical protein CLU79DRAFT_835067 [Phycomyces nitens]|nr:hypothetical protein CLU79DRAFT_835067 [Phycomyces nitens]